MCDADPFLAMIGKNSVILARVCLWFRLNHKQWRPDAQPIHCVLEHANKVDLAFQDSVDASKIDKLKKLYR